MEITRISTFSSFNKQATITEILCVGYSKQPIVAG